MDRLAHLATFVSLIYGLGVANVLAHLAALIKRGRRADWYWVHTLWTLALLLMMASFWWVLQNWVRVERIGFFDYLSMLVVPSGLFLASDLLFPERTAEGAIDLRAHFMGVRKPFFLAMTAILVGDQVDTLLKGWTHVVHLGPFYWASQVAAYGGNAFGYFSSSGRAQAVVVLVTLGLFLANMVNALASV
jgi:hypothetical protein